MKSAFFLSYRRDDSAGFAGRLADALENSFGPCCVFRDVDDIGPGADFIHTIESQLRDVGAVLVMIGPHWLAAGTDGQRRLDAKDDFVHLEIQLALASSKPLIPLPVGGARMPADSICHPRWQVWCGARRWCCPTRIGVAMSSDYHSPKAGCQSKQAVRTAIH